MPKTTSDTTEFQLVSQATSLQRAGCCISKAESTQSGDRILKGPRLVVVKLPREEHRHAFAWKLHHGAQEPFQRHSSQEPPIAWLAKLKAQPRAVKKQKTLSRPSHF